MLTIDYANCLSARVGAHGLDGAVFAPDSPAGEEARRHTRSLAQTRGTGWERWRGLPFEPMRSEHLAAVRALADRLRPEFDNLIVLGIGGSSLGAIALQAALNPATWNLLPAPERNGPRLFVLDNVDPAFVGGAVAFVRAHGGLERTLVCVVSKSGETAETAAQFIILRQMLVDAFGQDHARHVVAVTDPAKGTLRSLCDECGYPTLPVPDGVGGRFSVLSPVGLFPAAMCGIDIEALLDGAAAMDERCSSENLRENPAAVLATLLVRLARERGKANHVLMPYSNALYPMADWFRQLWAESLGKRVDTQGREVFAGFTPIKALGATDQHSQVQLYREGPNDKVIGLMEVERHPGADLPIPAGAGAESLRYLEGSSLGALLAAELRATAYALTESQRPNFTIRFPVIDARHIGEFIQMWQVATAYAGLMLGVDAYDQPAVELGKQATFALMGRAGHEGMRAKVEQGLAASEWRV